MKNLIKTLNYCKSVGNPWTDPDLFDQVMDQVMAAGFTIHIGKVKHKTSRYVNHLAVIQHDGNAEQAHGMGYKQAIVNALTRYVKNLEVKKTK